MEEKILDFDRDYQKIMDEYMKDEDFPQGMKATCLFMAILYC